MQKNYIFTKFQEKKSIFELLELLYKEGIIPQEDKKKLLTYKNKVIGGSYPRYLINVELFKDLDNFLQNLSSDSWDYENYQKKVDIYIKESQTGEQTEERHKRLYKLLRDRDKAAQLLIKKRRVIRALAKNGWSNIFPYKLIVYDNNDGNKKKINFLQKAKKPLKKITKKKQNSLNNLSFIFFILVVYPLFFSKNNNSRKKNI